jgi:hypothetical protein
MHEIQYWQEFHSTYAFMHVGKLALVLDTSKSDIFDGQGQAEKEDGEYDTGKNSILHMHRVL